MFTAICGMERKNLVLYVLELSRVPTWLRQWSYTGLLREQSHVAAFSVRLFSPHSWEFRRLWLKTLTGSRSYKMQQTWQRLSISLTAFFPPSLPLFSFVECGRMQLSPQGTLQLQQMGGIHGFRPPDAGKKRDSFSILLTVKTLSEKFASIPKARVLV